MRKLQTKIRGSDSWTTHNRRARQVFPHGAQVRSSPIGLGQNILNYIYFNILLTKNAFSAFRPSCCVASSLSDFNISECYNSNIAPRPYKEAKKIETATREYQRAGMKIRGLLGGSKKIGKRPRPAPESRDENPRSPVCRQKNKHHTPAPESRDRDPGSLGCWLGK